MSIDDQAEACPDQRSGGPKAWFALYDQHAEAVWRLVARLVGPRKADVADVVQETFMAAARSFDSFDPTRGTPWAWLRGIARHQVALHFRNQQRHARLVEGQGRAAWARDQLVAWLDGRQESAPDLLSRTETVEAVRVALAMLDPPHADALVARYFEDQDIQEIARQDGCTATAIRSRLVRARKAFRHVLKTMSPSIVDAGDKQNA